MEKFRDRQPWCRYLNSQQPYYKYLNKKNRYIMRIAEFTPEEKNIGKIIQTMRVMRGWSRPTLAEKVGVTQQQLQKYECAINHINISRLQRFAKVFEVDINVFLHGEKFIPLDNQEPESLRGALEIYRNLIKLNKKEIAHIAKTIKLMATKTRKKRVV